MRTYTLKAECPESVKRHKGTSQDHIYRGWLAARVEPYGKVIAPYGNKAPYNRPHVAARLALPGISATTAIALDEFADPVDLAALPAMPSCLGQSNGSHLSLGY